MNPLQVAAWRTLRALVSLLKVTVILILVVWSLLLNFGLMPKIERERRARIAACDTASDREACLFGIIAGEPAGESE